MNLLITSNHVFLKNTLKRAIEFVLLFLLDVF